MNNAERDAWLASMEADPFVVVGGLVAKSQSPAAKACYVRAVAAWKLEQFTQADAHLTAARFYAENSGRFMTKPCLHIWVAGMMYVDDEDVAAVATVRPVVCQKCEVKYEDRDKTQDNPG